MGSIKAAVFIILGQSNAVGHRVPMQERDMIHFTPELNMWVAESIFEQYHS